MKQLLKKLVARMLLTAALIPSVHASEQIQTWFDRNESAWKYTQKSESELKTVYQSLEQYVRENSISPSELAAFSKSGLGESAHDFLLSQLRPFRERGITPSQLQMETILRETLARTSMSGMTWSMPCESFWEAIPPFLVAAIPTVFAVINVKGYRKEHTPEYQSETQKMTDEKQSLMNRVSAINDILKNQTAIDLKLVGERDQANQKIGELAKALERRGLTTKLDRNLSVGASIFATTLAVASVIGGCE